MLGDLPRVAGLGRRVGAMVYDGLIVLALWLVTLFVLVAALNHAVMGPFVQSLFFIEAFLFFTFFWTRRGQTVGMLAWGLHVETADGGAVRPGHALLRFIGALASLRARDLRVRAQRLRHAGSKSIRLNQHRHQRPHVVHLRA